MRAVKITNRMSEVAISLLRFVNVNDLIGGAVPFSAWLLSTDGQAALDDLEETLHAALSVVRECREKVPESAIRQALAIHKEREDLP